MSFDYTPPALMSVHGLPVDDPEPHAQIGNHVRVTTHPMLGLPIAPFIIDVALIEYDDLQTRSTAVFFDRFENQVTPPVAVTPGNPITARIERDPLDVCVWAQVDTPDNSLVCEAHIDSALGPAPIGSRSRRRYAFTGPGLTEIVISGQGVVTGLRWMEANDEQHIKYEPLGVLNLPVESGLRYVSVVDPIQSAVARVHHQAPKRRPLQETVNAPAPASAPLADIPFEVDRVESLLPLLFDDLDHLVNHSTPPLDQVIIEPIVDEHGVEVGTSSVFRLHRVLQAQADPGTATFIGFKHRHEWFETEDRIFFYRVLGFFDDHRPPGRLVGATVEEALFDALVANVPAELRDWTKDEFWSEYQRHLGEQRPGTAIDEDGIDALAAGREYFGLGAVALVDRGAPLDQVPAPQIVGTEHRTWLPATPPTAVREVVTDVAGVRVAGLLAAGKRTPPGGPGAVYTNLDKANADGFHLPLVLSIDVDESTGAPLSAPGTGFVADRSADPSDIRYLIAQQDRFGRWSQWSSITAPPGPRPRPPRPEFIAFYQQPPVADAATTGGEIRVEVMVPDAEALAPGSHLLDHLRLTVHDQTLGTTTVATFPESGKQPVPDDPTTFELVMLRTGPVLAATEQRKLTLTAHWVDVAGTESAESTPRTLTLADPRPPAQIPLPDELLYSARPDVTGLAWVEHRWTSQPGQGSFGVYYTDENRLLSYLATIGRDDVLAEIDAAEHAAARATVYRTNGVLFTGHLFERLRDVGTEYNSGEVGFRHPVSGSLRILNFYKIAAESDTGARPELTDLEMIVFGVPNSDPPPRPTVAVRPAEPIGVEPPMVAEVTVDVVAGTTVAETWRLRRSSQPGSNVGKMPVVATGPMGPVDSDSGRQQAVHRDGGPVVVAPDARLRSWTRYRWVAEVQGAPESGSVAAGQPVAGRWSRASDPVSAVLIPQDPPAPPTITGITGTPDPLGLVGVEIELAHPGPLAGGAMGAYRVRVSRRSGVGEPLVLVGEPDVYGEGPHVVAGVGTDEGTAVITTGTVYEVVVIDPIGRASDPVTGVVP